MKQRWGAGTAAHTCNLSTPETETEGLPDSKASLGDLVSPKSCWATKSDPVAKLINYKKQSQRENEGSGTSAGKELSVTVEGAGKG